jgi:hypothetical protein
MQFLVLVKANEQSEAGVLPGPEILAAMGKYNEELVNAGMMLAGAGLQPSSKGARVAFSGDKRSVVDGPFAETKELIAGYWLIQAKSMAEMIEWIKRAPFQDGEVEIRPLFEPGDFAPSDPTGELGEAEARLAARVSEQQKAR